MVAVISKRVRMYANTLLIFSTFSFLGNSLFSSPDIGTLIIKAIAPPSINGKSRLRSFAKIPNIIG